MRSLQQAGLVSSHYGRIRIVRRKRLEAASCECYEAVKSQVARLLKAPTLKVVEI